MKNFTLYTISLTLILFVSGVAYYFLAPFNWGAGELVMHFHLWVGVGFTLYLMYAIPKHIKSAKAKATNAKFTKLSYGMLAVFALTLLSGLLHFFPYISYFVKKPFYYRFETYQLISNIHFILAILLIVLFILHLSLKHRNN